MAEIQDPAVIKILNSFFDLSQNLDRGDKVSPIGKVISRVRYKVAHGPCFDHFGAQRTASVVSHNLGNTMSDSMLKIIRYPESTKAEICYSMPRLLKIPKAGLHTSLIALTGHELSHLFGYGETEAIRFQKFLLGDFRELVENPSDNPLDNARFFGINVLKEVEDLLKTIQMNESEPALCMKIGEARQLVLSLKHAVLGAEESSRFPGGNKSIEDFENSAGQKAWFLDDESLAWVGFCGIMPKYSTNSDGEKINFVSAGNREELKIRMMKARASVQQLNSMIRVELLR
jgi:hypothetical protein